MNIADEYSTFTYRRKRLPRDAMRDTQVRLEGPIVWDFVPVFAEGWERSGGEALPMSPEPTSIAGGAECLVLDSRPRRGHRETAAVLAAIVAGARQSCWVTNA